MDDPLLLEPARGPCSSQGVLAPRLSPGLGAPGRLRLPGWILLGATGRRAGKTELACSLIRAASQTHPVVGVKVTVVSEEAAGCPRGGAGCGACSSLEGDFQIAEERGEVPGKDTARMLASGARRVFWLRCRRDRMRAALEGLLPRLGRDVLVVAESNSLAHAAQPDLFLMLTGDGQEAVKPTATAALPLAQRLVGAAAGDFDLAPRHLAVVDGVWHLVEASAAILAGGKSSRMGRDKGLLPVKGTPLIQRVAGQLREQFDELLISTNTPERHACPGARAVADWAPGRGPLMGIASALEAASHARLFVVACDIPLVHLETVRRMLVLAEDHDCVIPRSPAGPEPLFAVYRKGALPAMREALAAGEGRISAVFPRVRTHLFDLGWAPWYRNLNTPEDLAAFLKAG